jgi:alpha-ketoglutarate-dependent 2,4-dichlorophenoxyacetate dioxygenase
MLNKVSFEPLGGVIGAAAVGVDMTHEPGPAVVETIEDALERYGVLVFRDQDITPQQQVQFSKAFGALELSPRVEDRHPDQQEIFVIGNGGGKAVIFAPDKADDDAEEGELEWHTDHSQYPVPARATMLYGIEVPPVGGDTVFACTYSSYDALGEQEKAAYDGVVLLHSVRGLNEYLRDLGKNSTLNAEELELEKATPQQWPLVRRHPRSHRKALYFGSRMCVGAVGMSEHEGRQLIRQVTEHATQPAFVYRHHWRKHDVVFWDNRRLIHAATSFNMKRYTRVIHRTTFREDGPVVA